MSIDAYSVAGYGQTLYQPLRILSKRDPVNGVDIGNPGGGSYIIDQKWLNTVNENYWRYQGQGIWIKDSGSTGPMLDFIVPNGSSPVFADSLGNITLTSTGSSVAITGSTNSINFDVVGTGDLIWQTIFASQSLAAKNGYICISPGGALLLALPAVSSLGDTIEVTLDGATSFTITQPNSTSQVRYGNITTTLGTGGSLTTTNPGDTIRIVCQTANSRWNILSSIGNITYV